MGVGDRPGARVGALHRAVAREPRNRPLHDVRWRFGGEGDGNVVVVLDDPHSGLPGGFDVLLGGPQDDVTLLVLRLESVEGHDGLGGDQRIIEVSAHDAGLALLRLLLSPGPPRAKDGRQGQREKNAHLPAQGASSFEFFDLGLPGHFEPQFDHRWVPVGPMAGRVDRDSTLWL